MLDPQTNSETSDDRSRRLHCKDGAESGLAFHNALVCFRRLSQRVRLNDRFNFSLRHEIKGLVEIFGAVLLAANDPNALQIRSIREIESGSESAPIVTSRPSGRSP